MTNARRQLVGFVVAIVAALIMMGGFVLTIGTGSWLGLLVSGSAFVGAALWDRFYGRCWRCGQPLSRTALGFYAPIFARVCSNCGVRSDVRPGSEVLASELQVETAPILRAITGLFGITLLLPAAFVIWLLAGGFEPELHFPSNAIVFVLTVFGLLCLFVAVRGRSGS